MTDLPEASEVRSADQTDVRTTEPTGQRGPAVPEWLQNLGSLSWRVLVVVGFLVVLWFMATAISVATASIAVAIVVAAVFAPFVLRLRDRGRSRNAAAAIVWATAILVIGGVILVLVVALFPYLADIVASISDGVQQAKTNIGGADVPSWLSSMAQDGLDQAREAGHETVSTIVGSVASVVTILILATFLVFFFLRDGDKAWLWIFQALGPSKLERITTAGDDALARVGGYLRGTTVLGAVMGISSYVFMFLLGVPLAVPLAILAFAATYIPYIGGMITTAAILLVTFGTQGLGSAAVMAALVALRGMAVSSYLRPAIYGRTVSMHPALVLIVLPAGFQIAGMIGLFAAVPITAVILTVARAARSIVEPDVPPPLPVLVPAWLDRMAQWSWRALVAFAVIALLVLILITVPLVVVPLILALIVAATLNPIVAALERRGRTRGMSTAISVSLATLAIVGVLALTMVSLVEQSDLLGNTVVAGSGMINEAAGGTLGLAHDAVSSGAGVVNGTIVSIAETLGTLGAVMFLSILLTFYFLRDGAGLWERLGTHARTDAAQALGAAGRRAFDVLGGYMIGTAAISFVGAASQFAIMVVLGLPLALPVFVLSFFGGFIPYIGGAVTTLVAFLVAVSVGDDLDIVIMGIWTIVFNLVQGNVVAPLVYGRTTHIHPAVVLVAIPAGGAIAGIAGMFIVVPAIGVVATTWRTVLSLFSADDTPGDTHPTIDPGPEIAGMDPAAEPGQG